MSFLALPPHLVAQPQAPLDPRADWITPQELLYRLALPIAKELVHTNKDKFKDLSDVLEQPVIDCVVRSILRRSDLSDEGPKKRIPSLVDQIVDPSPLPSSLTTWYKALKLIDELPKKVPPLPNDSHHIFNGICPKQICSKMKQDGTPYKINETCTLILIPEKLGDPDECEKIIKDYGIKRDPEGVNPLQYGLFWDEAHKQHGKVKFGPTRWILHSDNVLEGSRNKTLEQHAVMVNDLAKETLTDWQIPKSFYEPLLTIFFTEIATRKRLYQMGNQQNGGISTYARVNQMTKGFGLVVGGFANSGVHISRRNAYGLESVGVAVRLEFPGT